MTDTMTVERAKRICEAHGWTVIGVHPDGWTTFSTTTEGPWSGVMPEVLAALDPDRPRWYGVDTAEALRLLQVADARYPLRRSPLARKEAPSWARRDEPAQAASGGPAGGRAHSPERRPGR